MGATRGSRRPREGGDELVVLGGPDDRSVLFTVLLFPDVFEKGLDEPRYIPIVSGWGGRCPSRSRPGTRFGSETFDGVF